MHTLVATYLHLRCCNDNDMESLLSFSLSPKGMREHNVSQAAFLGNRFDTQQILQSRRYSVLRKHIFIAPGTRTCYASRLAWDMGYRGSPTCQISTHKRF